MATQYITLSCLFIQCKINKIIKLNNIYSLYQVCRIIFKMDGISYNELQNLWGIFPEPMIDLDNRYRLMRGEKPLSPEGCPLEKFEEFERMTLEEFNKFRMENI